VLSSFWVKGDILPFIFKKGTTDLMKFLLRVAKEAGICSYDDGQGSSSEDNTWRRLLSDGLHRCISNEHWDLAELLITEFGVGMPISDIFNDIAVPEEERQKRKYYQGLQIRGKHRLDWAAEAGGEGEQAQATSWRERTTSPFIKAVQSHSKNVIDFWQGDACMKMYEKFGERNKEVKSIERITKEYGSWSKAVTAWLGIRKHLALHCALLRGRQGGEQDNSLEIVQYILECAPDNIERKSGTGIAPLWIAFYFHQVEAAKLLIEAGADQTTRDKEGRNILHALLLTDPRASTESEPDKEKQDLDKIEALLKLVDTRVITDLFTSRCSIGPTGLTPFAAYIWRGGRNTNLLQLIHRYMPKETFTIFDGSGQTPAHYLVIESGRKGTMDFLEELAALHPSVLMHDNAMGQLPLELAWTLYLRHQTAKAPSMHDTYFQSPIGNLAHPSSDLKFRTRGFQGDDDSMIKTYYLLRQIMQNASKSGQTPRRYMISVRDAGEVARRLSEKNTSESPKNGAWDELQPWFR
jgi:hypothetical protein